MCENERPAGMSGLHVSRRTIFTALGVGVGLGTLGLPGAASAAVAGWSNPTLGTLTSGYKTSSRPDHLGWDIANTQGTPVYALAAGTVRDIRTGSYPGDQTSGPLPGRTGNSVHIDHANSYFSYYGHLHRVLVSKGQRVLAGQLLGLMGTTGNSTGPHLHFEVHRPRLTSMNPRTFLSNQGISLGATAPLGSTGWPSVGQGTTSWVARTIQYLLLGRGVAAAVDGYFGPGCATSVRNFQSSRGLYVDGVVGPISWTALILPLQQGNSGNTVRGLQVALNARLGTVVAVDGAFGTYTNTAVRNFQSSRGLTVDGVVGPVTWSTLI